MVSTSYSVAKSIPLDLSSAGPSEAAPPRELVVSIDAEGALYADAQRTDDAGLRGYVRAYVHEVTADDARARIVADPAVSHGRVVRVMDLLRREHLSRFAISIRPDEIQH